VEEVVGVVLLFQFCQSLIVGAVGDWNSIVIILAEVVHIDTAGGEGMQRFPAVAGPAYVPAGIRRVKPLRDDYGGVWEGAMAECHRVRRNPGCCTTDCLHENAR
jgi:hypothetical protein